MFALKTYRTEDARKYHDTESDAFRRLRYNGRPPPNLIAFYGGFERGSTYNILLEYADGGTLEYFLRTTKPPVSRSELLDFWEAFFGIYHGLARIHGEDEQAGHEPKMLLG